MLPCVVSLLECAHRELVANLEDALCCLQLVLEQNRLEKQPELHGLAQFFFLSASHTRKGTKGTKGMTNVAKILKIMRKTMLPNAAECCRRGVLWPSDSPLLLPPEPALHLSDLSAADAWNSDIPKSN